LEITQEQSLDKLLRKLVKRILGRPTAGRAYCLALFEFCPTMKSMVSLMLEQWFCMFLIVEGFKGGVQWQN
jgi:hypothetical protein